MTSWAGLTLGNYQIGERIGKGGFGEVYKAVELGLDRTVAVKVLIGPDDINDTARAKLLERFQQEAKIIASLDHYNILPIFAFSQYQNTPYLVMPMMDKSLSQKLREANGKMPLEQVIILTQQVCAGLQYAHDRNIVHRDIKPPNILLNKEETRAVIADFGIARIISNFSEYTSTSIIIGSPLYMAPEQQGGAVGRRSDIYSLGLTVYELLTGMLPREHIYKPLIPPSRLRGDIPPVLDPVILRALAKDPDERFQSADEFSHALGDALASVGIYFDRSRTSPTPIPNNYTTDTQTQALPRTPTGQPYTPTPNPYTPGHYNPTHQPTAYATPQTPQSGYYAVAPTVNITPGLQQATPLPPTPIEPKPKRKRGIYMECGVMMGVAFAVVTAVVLTILATGNFNNSNSGNAAVVGAIPPTQISGRGAPTSLPVAAATTNAINPAPPATIVSNAEPTAVATSPTSIGSAPTALALVPTPSLLAATPTLLATANPQPTPRTFAILGFAALNRNTDKPDPSDSVTGRYAAEPLYLYIQVGGQTQPEDIIIRGLPGGDVPIKIAKEQNAFVFPLEQGLPTGNYKLSLLFLGQPTELTVELNVSDAPTPTPVPPTPRPTTAPQVVPTTVAVEPTSTATAVPVKASGTVIVRVVNSAGQALAGIAVTISGAGGGSSGATGGSGTVSFQLPEGSYNVQVGCSKGVVQSGTTSLSGNTVSVSITCP